MGKYDFHLIVPLMQRITRPVVDAVDVEMIPAVRSLQLSGFTQKLIAPPAAPQVSGRVIQASVWIPRSIHWLRERSTLTA